MPTDLALPGVAPAITGGNLAGLAVLEQWVTAASHAARLVEPLIASAFVPEAYKPRIPANADDNDRKAAYQTALGNATSAVLLGMSLGVDPLTALQNIYIVHGRPGMYSKFKAAIALAAGHEVWVEERSADAVTVAGRRKGWAPDRIVRVTITMDDAKQAGWPAKNDNYTKTPADMLQWRAMGRVVDLIAPDTLSGIASIEDLDDIPTDRTAPTELQRRAGAVVSAQHVLASREADLELATEAAGTSSAALRAAIAETTPSPAPAESVSQHAPAPVAEPEPARSPQSVDANADDNAEGLVTRSQLSKLSVLLGGKFGIGGTGSRAERHRVVSAIVERPLTSATELTKAEASRVIDALEGTTKERLYKVIGQPPASEPEQPAEPAEPAASEPTAEEPPIDPWGINP